MQKEKDKTSLVGCFSPKVIVGELSLINKEDLIDKQQTPDKDSRGKEVRGFTHLCHPKLDLGSRRLKAERFRIKYGMTPCNNNAAFTLIELLVVVLIIGILAAVALPQYQKAVERSKATQALTLLKAIVYTSEAYYLANGKEFESFDDLDINIPWTGRTSVIGGKPVKSNDQWSLELEQGRWYIVWIHRNTGKYKGAGFLVTLAPENKHSSNPNILCTERIGAFDSSLAPGAYCEKIMKANYKNQDSTHRRYSMN